MTMMIVVAVACPVAALHDDDEGSTSSKQRVLSISRSFSLGTTKLPITTISSTLHHHHHVCINTCTVLDSSTTINKGALSEQSTITLSASTTTSFFLSISLGC